MSTLSELRIANVELEIRIAELRDSIEDHTVTEEDIEAYIETLKGE